MTSPAWRTAAVVALSALSVPAAGLAAFFALVVGTGCFLSCEQADPLGGALLWLLTAALLAAGPGVGWLLLRGTGVARAVGGLVLGGLGTAVLLGVGF